MPTGAVVAQRPENNQPLYDWIYVPLQKMKPCSTPLSGQEPMTRQVIAPREETYTVKIAQY